MSNQSKRRQGRRDISVQEVLKKVGSMIGKDNEYGTTFKTIRKGGQQVHQKSIWTKDYGATRTCRNFHEALGELKMKIADKRLDN